MPLALPKGQTATTAVLRDVNLVSSAVRYRRPDRPLRVRIVPVVQSDGTLRIRISDNGRGTCSKIMDIDGGAIRLGPGQRTGAQFCLDLPLVA